jgi:hypothetical protein
MPLADVVVSDMDNLICGECGAEFEVRPKGTKRGPGSFPCEVCGEDIFLWICDGEVNDDYVFVLIRRGDSEVTR